MSRSEDIVIRNWDRFQHYKKRSPPWIRLYRDVLDKPEYRALSDSAARLLVELWLLASEVDPGGRVPMDVNLICWRTGRKFDDPSVLTSLQELAEQRFIAMPGDASIYASTDASTSTPQRQSTETEGREQRERQTRALDEFTRMKIRGLYGWGGVEGLDPILYKAFDDPVKRDRCLQIAMDRLEAEPDSEYRSNWFRQILTTVIKEQSDDDPWSRSKPMLA